MYPYGPAEPNLHSHSPSVSLGTCKHELKQELRARSQSSDLCMMVSEDETYDGARHELPKRASSSYSHDTSERHNDEALENLQDRVSLLKRTCFDGYHLPPTLVKSSLQ
ncbi:hypothetical protein YC2023_044908 [Brassica napus]